jgi:hypothetical protein
MKKWIEEQIEDQKHYIINRAKQYGNIIDEDMLFDVDKAHHPVLIYSDDDYAHHNFDLGKLIAFQDVLRELEVK